MSHRNNDELAIMNDKTPSSVSRYIEEYANASAYSYKEIALMAGFKTEDILYSFIRGDVRVPLDIVDKLAPALGCDAGQLFVLVLQQHFTSNQIEKIQESFFSAPTNAREAAWLREIRHFYKGDLPPLTPRLAEKLRAVLPLVR
jgi:hypothetical protein